MAILQSTGIRGFLVSVKKTGSKMLNTLGKYVDEYAENFLSGFAGYGWKLWEYTSGKWKLELDALTVRGTFSVYELLVQKIRAVKGALGITQGNGKIKTVSLSDDGTEYLITVEDVMSFVADDFIRCQTFTGTSVKLYHVKVQSISDDSTVIHLLVSDFDTDTNGTVTNPPEVGDEIVQFGNETDTTRQSAIYLHADEGGQPAIDVMFEIDSTDWTDKVKIRVGGEIPNSDGLKGFYCVNGMIRGVTDGGSVVYSINPDGSAMFGVSSVQFNSDKSGYLAGGEISWAWDESLSKFVTTLGNVVLSWDNLSDEVKSNITGSDGTSNYIFVRYSLNSDGSDMTNDPTDAVYIGVATTTENTAPTSASDYSWTKIKGPDGVKGDTGEDGTSSYVHIKYSDDGGVTFTDNNGEDAGTYIGVYSDSIEADSTDVSSYTWSKIKGENGADGSDGADANLLDWVEDWDTNKTQIDGEYVASPKMFSGAKNEDETLTGIAMGRNCITIDGVIYTGIFALVNGSVVFKLDPINQSYEFKGKVTATSGKIGGFNINENALTNDFDTDDAYIIFRYDPASIFAGIGTNVLPASTGVKAAARFENEDASDTWGFARNVALYLSAKNAAVNDAILSVSGWYSGFAMNTKQITDDYTLVHNVGIITCYNTIVKTITLPDPTTMQTGKTVLIKRMNEASVLLSGSIFTNSEQTSVYVGDSRGDSALLVNDGKYWCYNKLSNS